MSKLKKNRISGFAVIELLLIVAIVGVLGIGIVGWVIYKNHNATPTTTKPVPTTTLDAPPPFVPNSNYAVGVKFSATIVADGCATSKLPVGDVGCSLMLSSSITIAVKNGNVQPSRQWGSLINFPDYPKGPVGKRVEVYAHQLDKLDYTLEGSSDYYVKVTN